MRSAPLVLLLAACAADPAPLERPASPAGDDAAGRLRAAMEGWEAFPLADAPLRFAILDCGLPPGPVLRASLAEEGSAHARKLYALRVKDPEAYRSMEEAPAGQVLVKQSFVPRAADPAEIPATPPLGAAELFPFAARDGRVWTAGDPGPLFVMAKLDPATPGTDAGWIYGALSPEGEVLSAGLIDGCVSCHRSAPRDRQFGLPDVPWDRRPVMEVAREQAGTEAEWIRRAEQAAVEYAAWGRVDDETRWAPFLCRMPRPARARRSESDDGDTHGRKLYTLFARDRADYAGGEGDAPEGQVLVKETWVAEPVDPGALPERLRAGDPRALHEAAEGGWVPFAFDDQGRAWRAAERGPLFLMMKLAADTPGTDRGWVYATVDTSGAVTSAGALTACIACHASAPRDRQFGLPDD